MTEYEQCSDGPFHPFRDHDTRFGWGVRVKQTGAVFALVGAKGVAFGLSAALNGHWAAAQLFIGDDVPFLTPNYLSRFIQRDPAASDRG